MKKFYIFVLLLMVLTLVSCTPSDSAKNVGSKSFDAMSVFVAPADGKITEDQVTRYIAIAIDMTNELKKMSEKMRVFKEKYKITEDIELENVDKYGKDAKSELDGIRKEWDKIEPEIYKRNMMNQDEFEWVAAGLTEPANSEMQKKIESALSVIE